MIDVIKEVSCTRCLHQEVCKYKQDFLDICNKVKTTPITNLDCLGGIQIECRYYQMQAINPRLFDTTITNPCDIHTSPSPCVIHTSSNPYAINGNSDCTMPNPLNTIKKENN